MEEFRDIPGYEGMYQVSNEGRVKSLSRVRSNGSGTYVTKERILKQNLVKGYSLITLCKEGKTKSFRVHKLVVIVFLGHTPYGHKEVVDHINNISTDNRVENLQIISQRENTSKDKKNGSSKYVGVSWDKRNGKWVSRIAIKRKQIPLGYFNDEYEAHLKYQKALKNLDKYNGDNKQFRKYLELC